jgi:heme-degrading monooxygenase HmoA
VSTHYVSSRWKVKRGREDEFVAAFETFALWAELNHPEGGTARLLQNVDQPLQVTALWEFPGAEAIERWRGHGDVVEHMARLESLAEQVDESVFEVRVVVGG